MLIVNRRVICVFERTNSDDVVACWRGAGFPQLCNLVTGHCVNSLVGRKFPLVIVLEVQ